MRVLILGGTGFIGPNHVHAALERGHTVSTFNRGKSGADLPSEVEQLVGDRQGDLAAIADREWDVVIDLAVYKPNWVRKLGEALKDRVAHYTFISTIEVYANPGNNVPDTSESSELKEYNDAPDPYSPKVIPSREEIRAMPPSETLKIFNRYGPLKRVSESEVEQQFPHKNLIVRPGYIVGRGDPQPWLPYWCARLEKGGEILVAGDPLTPVQLIDVRDLAEWVVGMAERGERGIYNAVGPSRQMTIAEMLGAMYGLSSEPAKLTWVPAEWLNQQAGSQLWGNILFWSSASGGSGYAPAMRMNVDKATAKGLTHRPVSEISANVHAWIKSDPARSQSLAAQSFGSTEPPIVTSWDEYIEREQETLMTWRREASNGRPKYP